MTSTTYDTFVLPSLTLNEYCCASCGSSGAVSEIHIYSPTNVFERSVTVLDALIQVFSPSFQMSNSDESITMCIRCAEAVSNLYQAFMNLLSFTNQSSYLTKLITQIQNSHFQNPKPNPEEESLCAGTSEAFESSGVNDSKVSTSEQSVVGITSGENTVVAQVSIEVTPTCYPAKSKLHPDHELSSCVLQETPEEAAVVDDEIFAEKPKNKGRYVCRNIQKRRFFKCHKCPEEFIPTFELYDHIYTIHESRTKSKCGKCSFTYFPEITKFHTHKCIDSTLQNKALKRSRPFLCEICGERFGGARLLTFHIETVHTQENIRHRCNYCNKQLVDRHKLYLHLEIHNELKLYLCFDCGKSFSQKRGLEKHLEIHSIEPHIRSEQRHLKEVGTFPCASCEKVFSYKRNLQQHLTMHSGGVNKYRCPVCQKPHWTKKRLEKHILSHEPNGGNEKVTDNAREKTKRKATSDEEINSTVKLEVPQNGSDELGDDDEIHCHICGNLLPSQRHLQFHLRKHMTLEEKLVSLHRSEERGSGHVRVHQRERMGLEGIEISFPKNNMKTIRRSSRKTPLKSK